MATFVLVHGAWGGGWEWRWVRDGLRSLGHDVFTPTLTGLGERAHLIAPDVGLTTHIEDVTAVLECEELTDVVLCGQSSGGMVVTGVADRKQSGSPTSSTSTRWFPQTANPWSTLSPRT